MFADNPDFFPTPRPLARKMLAKITNKEAKYFLEPSAGKGDIAAEKRIIGSVIIRLTLRIRVCNDSQVFSNSGRKENVYTRCST